MIDFEGIIINADGYVLCESDFYKCLDIISPQNSFELTRGVNYLEGEIDSGVWAVSYLLSMYTHKSKNFTLYNCSVNKGDISLKELIDISCYMDKSFPLFNSHKTVYEMVCKGLKDGGMHIEAEQIRMMFGIDEERFNRPFSGTGNEIFKAMAAVGYCYNKKLFCFPWLSRKRFESYHKHLTYLLEVLEKLGMIVVVPIGR